MAICARNAIFTKFKVLPSTCTGTSFDQANVKFIVAGRGDAAQSTMIEWSAKRGFFPFSPGRDLGDCRGLLPCTLQDTKQALAKGVVRVKLCAQVSKRGAAAGTVSKNADGAKKWILMVKNSLKWRLFTYVLYGDARICSKFGS